MVLSGSRVDAFTSRDAGMATRSIAWRSARYVSWLIASPLRVRVSTPRSLRDVRSRNAAPLEPIARWSPALASSNHKVTRAGGVFPRFRSRLASRCLLASATESKGSSVRAIDTASRTAVLPLELGPLRATNSSRSSCAAAIALKPRISILEILTPLPPCAVATTILPVQPPNRRQAIALF